MTELPIAAKEGATSSEGRAVQQSLSSVLRSRTAAVHRTAERSGIIADILTGKASRFGYALLLANLLPAYRALEQQGSGGLGRAELHRAAAIEADLVAIEGPHWRRSLPPTAAASRYAQRILACRAGDGALAIAHAYVRYMGDLSGGQVLARLLARNLDLGPHQLSFYRFPAIADVAEYKDDYRRALDAVDLQTARLSQIADEAVAAFELNIAVSNEVQAAAGARIASC